jgi:hypothetical protein
MRQNPAQTMAPLPSDAMTGSSPSAYASVRLRAVILRALLELEQVSQ